MVLVMVAWGSTFVITKVAATEIPPLTLAFLRFAIATLALLPVVWARGGFRRMTRPAAIGPLVWMAITGIAFFTVAFNYGLVHATATQGALIYALGPAAIAVGAVLFLQERLSVWRTLGIALSTVGVGVVIVAGKDASESPNALLGALWMVSAIVAWTAYTLFAKRLADADQVLVITSISGLGALMLLPLAVVELLQVEWQRPSAQAWLGLLFLGTVASAVAYVVYSYALRILDASLVGVFTNLDPLVGVFTAVIFLNESLETGHVIGGSIAIAGMWLASTSTPAARQT
jgi:drug/metabolite transporter (DMT)-like permease